MRVDALYAVEVAGHDDGGLAAAPDGTVTQLRALLGRTVLAGDGSVCRWEQPGQELDRQLAEGTDRRVLVLVAIARNAAAQAYRRLEHAGT